MDWFPFLQVGALFFDALVGGVSCLQYLQSRRILTTLKKTPVINLTDSLDTLLENFSNQRIEYIGIRGKIGSLQSQSEISNQITLPSRSLMTVYKSIMKSVYELLVPSNEITQAASFTHSLTLRPVMNSHLPFTVYIDNIAWRDTVTSRSDAYVALSNKLSNMKEGFTEGMIVTIYGKLQRLAPGEIRIQYSGMDEAPYIFTTLAPAELFRAQQQEIFRHRLFFLLYTVVGALVLARIVWRGVHRHLEHNRKYKLMKSLEKMTKIDKAKLVDCEPTLCIICRKNHRNVIFDECEHIALCNECAAKVNGICPVCSVYSSNYKYPIFPA